MLAVPLSNPRPRGPRRQLNVHRALLVHTALLPTVALGVFSCFGALQSVALLLWTTTSTCLLPAECCAASEESTLPVALLAPRRPCSPARFARAGHFATAVLLVAIAIIEARDSDHFRTLDIDAPAANRTVYSPPARGGNATVVSNASMSARAYRPGDLSSTTQQLMLGQGLSAVFFFLASLLFCIHSAPEPWHASMPEPDPASDDAGSDSVACDMALLALTETMSMSAFQLFTSALLCTRQARSTGNAATTNSVAKMLLLLLALAGIAAGVLVFTRNVSPHVYLRLRRSRSRPGAPAAVYPDSVVVAVPEQQ